MSVSLVVDSHELDEAIRKWMPLFNFEPTDLMTAIAALGESQTRRRIAEEKTAPDGTPWPENLAGTPILVESGQHLLASLAWTASADEAEWGATWEWAHVHQDGMTIKPKSAGSLVFEIAGRTVHAKEVTIPPRPFVGLSSENEREMIDLVTDYFGSLQ